MKSAPDSAPEAAVILDAMSAPILTCREDGSLTYVNAAFRALVGDEVARVQLLIGAAPSEGAIHRWEGPDGGWWRVHLRAIEGGFLGELTQEPVDGAELVASTARRISRELTLPNRDEELIQAFVGICREMLPERLVCVRLFKAASGQLTQVYATGRLIEAERERLSLSRRAVETFGLPGLEVSGESVVTERYVPIFEDAVDGFDVPLHDGETLFGIMSVEYRETPAALERDMTVAGYLALHFVTTLRYARMLGESIYSRDFFVKLLDNANAPIIVTDRHRRITLINQAFEVLTGFSPRDVLDRDVKTFLAPEERERFLPAVVNALRGRTTRTLEVRIPHRDGEGVANISLSLAAVRSGFGEIEGVVAVGQDLTELRRLQQQVIHSEKLATLGQLAAGVVHELNNPLTSISVYSEYLLKKLRSEGAESADITKLERICEGADRILRFTRDLVAYARPAGEEPRLVDLADVIERSLVFCEHVIDRANVEVATDFAPELPPVYGVKGQLQQILVNLITNACDAMSESGGMLAISLSAVEDRVQLQVKDTGPGIPPRDRERIFEPFFSTKSEGKGTGLGLSIVRNIITNHHGLVRVEPADDGGTIFVIELFAGD